MKTRILLVSFAVVTTLFVMAQGNDFVYPNASENLGFRTPHSITNTPPIDLPTAYNMALRYVAEVTNRFYCVSASCLELKGEMQGWTFCYANTNGARAFVDVSFENSVRIRPESAKILYGPNW